MKLINIFILLIVNTLIGSVAFSQINDRVSNEFETDATSQQTLSGLVSSQRFGYSVSNCGDLNGDGFDDIISGAQLTSSNTGRAYIYFGGNNINSTPSIVLNGEAANNYFGISVSGAGDVNADGFNDVIVGAYGYSSNTGRAYIYYGGYNMDNIADVVISAPVASSFGYSVSTAGDVNGDGFSDVIVSAHTYSSNKGRAYIYHGGLIMDNLPDKTLEGITTGGFFGFALSGAGDVNGDGYSDLVVGAYAVTSFTGKAYLYYGGAIMDTIQDVTFTGETTNSFFGQSVAGAGDLNGDGYSDLLIGASLYSSSAGRAYIFYGSGSVDETADVIFTGELAGNNFGRGISGTGDVNGDGYSDIIIGAQSYQSSKGRAYLYYGGVSMNNAPDMIFKGEDANNYFGFSVSGGGDINGDGYKDFIVGAYGHNSNKGKIYIYKNALKGNDIPDIITYGEFQNQLGSSISAAGDVNGDGYDDYIAGAPAYGDFARGRAYIYFGSAIPDTLPDITINGFTDNSWFGWSVAGLGDVNADGYDDIAISAPEYNSSQGRVFIYLGGAVMDTVHDLKMSGVTTVSRFGHSISSAGDMNGDGYSDIVIGSPSYQSSRGRTNVFFGGSPMDTVSDYNYGGSNIDDNLGISVACAGDINGDNYSDILIGVSGYSTSGAVYIVYGNTFNLYLIEEPIDFDYFGYSVSGAGDVNGDSFSDFLVGAPYKNSRGQAYLYFGGSELISSPVEFTGTEYEFGYSVSGSGDVNNDGYGDLIIGERGFQNNHGRAYIYFGGYEFDNSHDIVLNNLYMYEEFGTNVRNAGDINADGTDDVLVGSPVNDLYGGSAGAVYLYLSSPPSVKPIFISVKDVPNDQGGKVNLKWTRSAYDVIGNDMITDYLIQRSLPPGGGGFYWENIASIPATKESFYAYNVNTPFDSLAGNSGNLYYRITARTNSSSNFWRSNVLYGRSIDNIAPLMVSPFTAAASGPDVRLYWQRSAAPDLLNYVLFRSADSVIDPYTDSVWTTATDSTYLDISPLSGQYYYFITAQDIHNNYSPVAVAESPEKGLNLELTVFIEGFYNAGSNTQVSDTITAELRDQASPFAVIGQAKGVAGTDGTVMLNFNNAASGNYFIAVTHRNSIMTWSSSATAITSGGPNFYDMSTASTQAYGGNLSQVDLSPLRFAIFSGDENQNGIVDLSDVVNASNAASSFNTGYVTSDMNGDNVVDLSDLVITSNNASAFIEAVMP